MGKIFLPRPDGTNIEILDTDKLINVMVNEVTKAVHIVQGSKFPTPTQATQERKERRGSATPSQGMRDSGQLLNTIEVSRKKDGLVVSFVYWGNMHKSFIRKLYGKVKGAVSRAANIFFSGGK